MKTSNARVSLAYARKRDSQVIVTANTVLMRLYGNPHFAAPPVDEARYQAGIREFQGAVTAAADGGRAATAGKNQRRGKLLEMMRQLALYVEIVCGNDLAKLLDSGFEVASNNRAPSPLPAPARLCLRNGGAGEMLLTVNRTPNARCYEAEFALQEEGGGLGPWRSGGLHSRSRSIPIRGLIPGRLYGFKVRVVGGSTGHSDWSPMVFQRAV